MKRAFAEWEKQELLMVAAPHENTDWKPYLSEIHSAYVEFVKAASAFEKVLVIAPSFNDFLPFAGVENVEFFAAQTNDTWIRDYGAIDIFDTELDKAVSYDFNFNAWGGKFECGLDNALNSKLFGEFFGTNLEKINLILEGGSVEFNGEGVLLTTSECLLNDNRNALSKESLEERLSELFGLKKIIWLSEGFIKGDDTDSHIDTLARFVAPNVVALAACEDESDEHFAPLKALEKQVCAAGFEVVRLPLPSQIEFEGRRLGATYCNFVFVNGGLIVPTYNDLRADEFALEALQKALPNRKVVGVDASVFIRQNGSLHCSCQNRFLAKR